MHAAVFASSVPGQVSGLSVLQLEHPQAEKLRQLGKKIETRRLSGELHALARSDFVAVRAPCEFEVNFFGARKGLICPDLFGNIWTSFGHHLDIIWTSFGHHLDIIWTSFVDGSPHRGLGFYGV
jgi:hypothetical protein